MSSRGRRLAPVAGRFATQLFAVGLPGASALAAAVVPLSTAYATSEAAGAERSVSKSFRQAPLLTYFLVLANRASILGTDTTDVNIIITNNNFSGLNTVNLSGTSP